MPRPSKVALAELGQHLDENDGWMALNGFVWDFSGFANVHPGGADIIKRHLGKDGSEVYNEIHSSQLVLRHLGDGKRIGVVGWKSGRCDTKNDITSEVDKAVVKPSLSTIINISGFEAVAKEFLTAKAWSYISSATEDGLSHAANQESHKSIMFRPRILRSVGHTDISTSFLGERLSCPILIAPTSSMKLTHPDGEIAVAKASLASGVPPIIPSMGSYSVSEVVDAVGPESPFLIQVYIQRNRKQTESLLEYAVAVKATALIITVDSPVLSKRETIQYNTPEGGKPNVDAPPPANTVIDPNVVWDDIQWIMKKTKLPVFLKGIQCAEDAKRASDTGCAGIYISNHGGRALDTAPPAMLVLLEIHKACPEILPHMEIIIDGGFRRGSEILKAICLGASLVCIGRPFLYALVYGEAGVARAFESGSSNLLLVLDQETLLTFWLLKVLKEELRIAMQLLGTVNLQQASREYLNTSRLEMLLAGDYICSQPSRRILPRL